VARFRVGKTELTRVPYFDVPLDPTSVSLSRAQVRAVDWAVPTWADADGQVLIGQAVWVIESGGRVIVVDPCLAADPFIRSGPEAIGHQESVFTALSDAGFPRERVDVVVLSHLDGIGMAAAATSEGGWEPAFPNARIVMTTAELDALAGGQLAGGLDALNALIAQDAVDGVGDGYHVTDEVWLELDGSHARGHAVVRVRSDGERATFLGHLALSPLHLAIRDTAALHVDVPRALAVLDALVAEADANGDLLVGPLWPFPGAVRATGGRVVAAAVQG
jgi:hypothetical protein